MTHDRHTTPADQERLDRVRALRTRPEKDTSLGFLHDVFKREIEKPYKQLGRLSATWQAHVPQTLLEQTRLDGLTRGVLHVTVQSSAALYELDRLLRSGLLTQLQTESGGVALTRVKLELGTIDPD